MDKRGGGSIKIFRRKFFVSQCRKFSLGESFTVPVFLGTGKICIGWGSIKYFRGKLFVSQC